MTETNEMETWFAGLEHPRDYLHVLCNKCGIQTGPYPGDEWKREHFSGRCIEGAKPDLNNLGMPWPKDQIPTPMPSRKPDAGQEEGARERGIYPNTDHSYAEVGAGRCPVCQRCTWDNCSYGEHIEKCECKPEPALSLLVKNERIDCIRGIIEHLEREIRNLGQ